MALADADIAFATDLFSDLGHVTTRKMFGGMCLYLDGAVFALMSSDGQLYLKAKGDAVTQLADDGAIQFHNMPYWSIPDAALDDPQEACTLARQTIASLT
ncbi:DNA transformation protein [Yoonia maricola]|uniref:DNA transformation protein n=1 Tax=Yoonia maricola TaxID=420999 RepID=A0A2M8WKR7_9RHOB|nr:TfoX/Sxy family protein [Yoonia maricola]PJI91515.1 DNA transformation protein [Yoonia maricola]